MTAKKEDRSMGVSNMTSILPRVSGVYIVTLGSSLIIDTYDWRLSAVVRVMSSIAGGLCTKWIVCGLLYIELIVGFYDHLMLF